MQSDWLRPSSLWPTPSSIWPRLIPGLTPISTIVHHYPKRSPLLHPNGRPSLSLASISFKLYCYVVQSFSDVFPKRCDGFSTGFLQCTRLMRILWTWHPSYVGRLFHVLFCLIKIKEVLVSFQRTTTKTPFNAKAVILRNIPFCNSSEFAIFTIHPTEEICVVFPIINFVFKISWQSSVMLIVA